jgi:hypothetical protein
LPIDSLEGRIDIAVVAESDLEVYARRCRLLGKELKEFSLTNRFEEEQLGRVILAIKKVVDLLFDRLVNIS